MHATRIAIRCATGLVALAITVGAADRAAHAAQAATPGNVEPLPEGPGGKTPSPSGTSGSGPVPVEPMPKGPGTDKPPPPTERDPFDKFGWWRRWFAPTDGRPGHESIAMVRGPNGRARNATVIRNEIGQLRLITLDDVAPWSSRQDVARRPTTLSIETFRISPDRRQTTPGPTMKVPFGQFFRFPGLSRYLFIDFTPEQARFLDENGVVRFELDEWAPNGADAARGKELQTLWRPIDARRDSAAPLRAPESTTGREIVPNPEGPFVRIKIDPHASTDGSAAPFFLPDGRIVGIGGEPVASGGRVEVRQVISHPWALDHKKCKKCPGSCNGGEGVLSEVQAGLVAIPMVSGPARRRNAFCFWGEDNKPHVALPIDALGRDARSGQAEIEWYVGDAGQGSKRKGIIGGIPISRFRWLEDLPRFCILDLTASEVQRLVKEGVTIYSESDLQPGLADAAVQEEVEALLRETVGPDQPAPIELAATRGTGVESDTNQVVRLNVDPSVKDAVGGAPVFVRTTGLLVGVGGETKSDGTITQVISWREAQKLVTSGKPIDQEILDALPEAPRAADPPKVTEGTGGAAETGVVVTPPIPVVEQPQPLTLDQFKQIERLGWVNMDGLKRLLEELCANGFDGFVGARIVSLKSAGHRDQYLPAAGAPGERAVGVLSESQLDDLTLEIVYRGGAVGVQLSGNDRDTSVRHAALRINDPATIVGATRDITATSDDGARSNARVLVIEAGRTKDGTPPLPIHPCKP